MPEVNVKFNNQNFHLACKEGEGERLIKLAEYVNHKAAQISDKMGSITDTRLLLMTAILIADELDDAQGGRTLGDSGAENQADQLQETLLHTIKRIEDITREVETEG